MISIICLCLITIASIFFLLRKNFSTFDLQLVTQGDVAIKSIRRELQIDLVNLCTDTIACKDVKNVQIHFRQDYLEIRE